MEINRYIRALLLKGSGITEEIRASAKIEISRKRSGYVESNSS
jgi:hypothetical protein